MLKLHHSPMACSLACRLTLAITDIPHDVVTLRTWKGEQKTDAYRAINPRGKVPALETPEGILVENTAILPYIADLAPAKALLPAAGTFARARAQSWLSYLSSSLHSSLSAAMFSPAGCEGDACRRSVLDRAIGVLTDIDRHLATREHVLDSFSACDLYLTVFSLWRAAPTLSTHLPALPNLDRLQARVLSKPELAAIVGEDMKMRAAG
jgi:glutathione S-transferase